MIRSAIVSLLAFHLITGMCIAQAPVAEAANHFLEKVEQFDTVLHTFHSAEQKYIELVHHMEETGMEILELAESGHTAELKAEAKHLYNDLNLLYHRLLTTSSLLQNSQVVQSWNQMIYSHRILVRRIMALQ